MRIVIFGLGYVGAVSAACLARDGHFVTGVDTNPEKVALINAGSTPIIEEHVGEFITEAVANGSLKASTSGFEALQEADLSLVCVGTPSQPNGSLDIMAVEKVCSEIGTALQARRTATRHTVVIRSTILPGTMRDLVIPKLEFASELRAGIDFGVAFNPEFLRESTAVDDFYNPPKTVIGGLDETSSSAVNELYLNLTAPMLRTSIEVAEMVKYTDNSWHALKVAFANEIGNICKEISVDSHAVMDIFCKDLKLNLSSYYLKPGFAFGGSCLPKDLRALTYKARSLDLELPVLNSILPSNRAQVERGFTRIARLGKRKIGVLGISFKAGTDDLRESPLVELVERLIGKGYDLKIYDRAIELARLTGANKEYITNTIPHIADLIALTLDEVLNHAEVVVIGNNDAQFNIVPIRMRADQILVDLVRLPTREQAGGRYDGINW